MWWQRNETDQSLPQSVHWLVGRGLSNLRHVSIRRGKNNLHQLGFIHDIRQRNSQEWCALSYVASRRKLQYWGPGPATEGRQKTNITDQSLPQSVHWLVGRGLSNIRHISIRRGKNNLHQFEIYFVFLVPFVGGPQLYLDGWMIEGVTRHHCSTCAIHHKLAQTLLREL